MDSLHVEDALKLFPDQILDSWKQSMSSNIPKMNFKSVVISGMGGSSNAGKILESLFASDLTFPFVVHNDYGLPNWINSDTLVVANSYSGNTEETLSGIEAAKKVKAKILGVATGGKIGEMIKSSEISGVVIDATKTNPPNFPKTGLGASLGALAGALAKAGVISLTEKELQEPINELVEIRKAWDAKEIANWLKDSVPVLFSGRPLIGPLNAGRNVLCEVGRTFTLFFDFPEVNHVLIEATLKPDFVKEKVKYLFFESNFLHQRVKTRFEVTKKVFDEQGLDYKSYILKGKTKLTQSLEIPYFCAWVAFNLSILNSQDPGPEPWILELKESLSQPLH